MLKKCMNPGNLTTKTNIRNILCKQHIFQNSFSVKSKLHMQAPSMLGRNEERKNEGIIINETNKMEVCLRRRNY